ncbi:MAG: LLM class flavin-dependent oxidoreductase [Chloroflexota bacterium]|nr:LLM class flavin-dependent oxidoreductase [Chloroflexota bacterium]
MIRRAGGGRGAGLERPIGLGLAARGSPGDAVEWSRRAAAAGFESVWVHDSYFERDAVSYASAIAAQVDGIRVALGALNPYTRHPVVVAMTGAAIDAMAPRRVVMGIGTGLPLRLTQMGIEIGDAVATVSGCIDTLRALWAGERVALNPPAPPVQPMFRPPHRIPIFIAAYRREFVELAGRTADGYLARPAESLASLGGILRRLSAAATAAGRDPATIERAGYLLTHVDVTRREALNRAKREPFVIYMMSVLSEVSLRRAGFEVELRDRIAEAWRAEDFHAAAGLIPDEMLDAFIACGTAEDVAATAAAYADAGLDLPLLQPVLQEDDQIDRILTAGRIFGERGVTRPVPAGVNATGGSSRARRRAAALLEVLRPFSFTASIVPVSAGGALAAMTGTFNWLLFAAVLLAAVLLQVGTNVVNEIYDVRRGVDAITSPRASHALLKGVLGERAAFAIAFAAFGVSAAIGLGLVLLRGWPMLALGVTGLLGGYGYTAPPLEYKYRALGVPLVFVLMGPLMVSGSYFALTGTFDPRALILSIPVGLLVAAILHGNEWRDISEDRRAGIRTLSGVLGRGAAHTGYVVLVVGAYVTLSLGVMLGALPVTALLAMLSLPLVVQVLRSSELGATGQARAILMIDLETARLHFAFGALLVAGVAIAAIGR